MTSAIPVRCSTDWAMKPRRKQVRYKLTSRLDNYHCVRTHCVGLRLLLCAKTNYMRYEGSCHDWCFNFVREACPRGRPSEPSMFVWPGRKIVPLISSIRTRLHRLRLTELSIIFVYFGLVRISPKCIQITKTSSFVEPFRTLMWKNCLSHSYGPFTLAIFAAISSAISPVVDTGDL